MGESVYIFKDVPINPSITVFNSIIYANNLFAVSESNLFVVNDGISQDAQNLMAIFSSQIIDSDPLFVNTGNGNFSLLEGSLAIDLENNGTIDSEFDLAKRTKIQGGNVDLGAYEFPDDTQSICFGDADFNGVVDLHDILAISSNYGCTLNCTYGDADGNGMVDITDIISVSSNFGMICNGGN